MKESTTYSESISHIAMYKFFPKLRHTYIKQNFTTYHVTKLYGF